ncbi:response regulator [Aeromonas sp. 2HA2]|nr:response regulator [Aeromonas sp. 2HA2]
MDKMNLICVDDQREVLNAISRDLAPLASWLRVEECESAQECLTLMEELDTAGEQIALVVSDHVMPGLSGVELLTRIGLDGRFPHTRKILLTGQATHKDTIAAVNLARIDHYLEKPWQGAELLRVCRCLLTEFVLAAGIDYQSFIKQLDAETLYKKWE